MNGVRAAITCCELESRYDLINGILEPSKKIDAADAEDEEVILEPSKKIDVADAEDEPGALLSTMVRHGFRPAKATWLAALHTSDPDVALGLLKASQAQPHRVDIDAATREQVYQKALLCASASGRWARAVEVMVEMQEVGELRGGGRRVGSDRAKTRPPPSPGRA